MSITFEVPTLATASASAKPVFEGIKKKLGTVPNLYAAIGHSGEFLQSYLGHSTVAENHFSPREVQAVYLLVSQYNNCSYCLAAHTMLAKMSKFSEAETLALRQGKSSEADIQILLNLTQAIIENQGRVEGEETEDFFQAGYTKAQLVALVGLISSKTFSNYFHSLTQVPVDFPEAPAI